jgi:NagD protein
MDGVIYHGNRLLSGVEDFVRWLQKEDKQYLFLTNSSERSPMELQLKLQRLGLSVDAKNFYTSALATAGFLASQVPHGTAYVIGTNPDLTGPLENGIVPATGALILPIARTAGVEPYFVGKPNPVIMRQALKRLHSTREETAIIGDRMDTDIVSGIESEIDTVLVLSGVSDMHTSEKFAYRPLLVLDSVYTLAPSRLRPQGD